MPTFRHGKNIAVFADQYDVGQYFNEMSAGASVDTGETTAFGTPGGAKTYVTGIEDGTVSTAGMFDGTALAVDEYLSGVVGSGTDIVFTACWEGLAAIGYRATLCSTQETSYEVTSPVADVVSIKAEWQGNGGLDQGVVLAGRQAFGGTGASVNNTAVDNAAASTNGGVAHLHVTANARTAASTVKVQHSTDNTTFVDLVTFTAVGASPALAAQRVVIAPGTTVNRYVRAQVSPGGTTNTVTVTVSFARR